METAYRTQKYRAHGKENKVSSPTSVDQCHSRSYLANGPRSPLSHVSHQSSAQLRKQSNSVFSQSKNSYNLMKGIKTDVGRSGTTTQLYDKRTHLNSSDTLGSKTPQYQLQMNSLGYSRQSSLNTSSQNLAVAAKRSSTSTSHLKKNGTSVSKSKSLGRHNDKSDYYDIGEPD